MTIEVRVAGRGTVRGQEPEADPETSAHCDLCDQDVDVVVSVAPAGDGAFACKACLRGRLEATTVAQYLLRDASEKSLPWGKFSG
jgi:hypothetical protein